jgi:protein subunit release factor A
MITKIVTAVTEQLKKHLQPQMNGIDKKLDRIENRISNIEAYQSLRNDLKHSEMLIEKHDNDLKDIVNPKDVLEFEKDVLRFGGRLGF